ncbi:trigger factor [Marmoricola endophyticus]|uniref:Trigger factor n=1 Tax=Marmoricola endophyticus TaxID=2040280 RepID=A0A917BV69_9ACTN|nr:trigger factor [Marmoricola endophyticus]GGF58002.1 trigger factor [Marmoricola endophyticus]
MKSAVETLEPTRAKLTVEVPFEELKSSLDKAYQEIAKQVNIPGFRRGKVPPPVIDRQVGRGAVLDQAINEALPDLYIAALQENELVPLAQPEIDITKLEDGTVLEFTAEVTVRPTIELPSYDNVSASVDDVEVTDADVEEQVQALRERFATLSEVERPAAEGDFVSIDLAASKDGEAVEGGQLEDYSYQVGKGDMLPGIDEVLVGMSAGEEKSFTTQLLGGDMEGQDVEVLVTVGSVKEQELPELDEEFAQTASEFDTMDELTEDVRTRLGRGKRLEQAAAARDAVLEQLIEATEIPLPDEVVSAELASRRQEIEQQLGWAGMDLQTYLDNEKQTVDEFEADLDKRVRDMLAAQFILDEIAKKEEIDVEQEELSQHLMQRAQQSGQDPNEFIQHMLQHNHVPEMVAEVVRGKALAQIVESATVTDASGNVVELKNLRPDGSIGEPEDDGEPEVGEATEDTAADEATESSSS